MSALLPRAAAHRALANNLPLPASRSPEQAPNAVRDVFLLTGSWTTTLSERGPGPRPEWGKRKLPGGEA